MSHHLIEAADRIMRRCDELALITSMPDKVCRTYLTEEHAKCNERVHAWMRELDMHTWEDGARNCWGRLASKDEDAPVLILGSHLDTVVDAGKYDGILGVISAIEVARMFKEQKRSLPFHLDIVGFGDEEGTRFGATLLGSSALAGTWQDGWLDLCDQDGKTMAESFQDYAHHYRQEEVSASPHSASRLHENILGYLELHIEQGPVLEELDKAVGVVTAIAGAKRFQFELSGLAGHAGTVPMHMRQDALLAATKAIQIIESHAKATEGVVATVGKLGLYPNAVNVIPGKCQFTMDIRSGDDNKVATISDAIIHDIKALCGEHYSLHVHAFHDAKAVRCDHRLQAVLRESIEEIGLEPVSMLSGAGHDAMALDALAPVGMLFVRCDRGISHHPAEAVQLADVTTGLDVFYRSIKKLSDSSGLI